MRDLELWIEAVCDLPPNCYAAIRHGMGAESSIMGPPIACVPNKPTGLGEVGKDDGPIVVDIFQRVGSITMELPQAGAKADAWLTWPGKEDEALKLTAAIVPTGRKSFALAEKDGRKSIAIPAERRQSSTDSTDQELPIEDSTSIPPAPTEMGLRPR